MNTARSSRIFNEIARKGSDFVISNFGDVGRLLVVLFENLGNHPEADSFFFEDCDLGLCELFDLAGYAEKKGMAFFKNHIQLLVEAQSSETLKRARTPGLNGSHARFFRKPVRDAARLTRKIQRVGSPSFHEFACKFWSSLPNDFSSFHKDFLPNCSRKHCEVAKKLSDMGLKNLGESASGFARRFFEPESFLGYKALSVLDASMTLAKNIGVSADLELNRLFVRTEKGLFLYSPAIVPIHLVDGLPERVKISLEDSEHCRSLMFDAVFDNHFVLVPLLGDRFFGNSQPERIFPELKDHSCSLASGVRSVLMGERDGKCYFICEWN